MVGDWVSAVGRLFASRLVGREAKGVCVDYLSLAENGSIPLWSLVYFEEGIYLGCGPRRV